MNKRQKEVLQHQFDSEKAVLEQLEKQYQAALNDINRKIRILQSDEMTQSKIYRMEYQKALKKQVESILEKLHGDEFTTIQEYLSASYTDAFIGTMYDLAGQGIPLIIPLDQAAAVKAILTDSKISKGLYSALGIDVNDLKKTISAEVTRGIASGLSYHDIARNIDNVSNTTYYNAVRIARTEGHRIQQASTKDAQQKSKSKGADVVKQWDATLDGKTRDSHRRVDGEIRELDELFSNGLDYPGDPKGSAKEVINCRCVSLTRARWALDEDELNTLKERAEYFELDKSKNFADFKDKYLKAAKQVETDHLEKFVRAANTEEAAKYAKETLGLNRTTAYSSGMNVEIANGLNEALHKLTDKFGSITESGYLKSVEIADSEKLGYAAYQKKNGIMLLNKVVGQTDAVKVMAAEALEEFTYGSWSSQSPFHSVYHELGHAVQYMLLDNNPGLQKKIDVLYSETYSAILGAETEWVYSGNLLVEYAKKAKDAGFSYYGLRNSGEFVAESIAQYFCSDNPGKIAKSVIDKLARG